MRKSAIYIHSYEYAQEHDELKKYLASFKAHKDCKDAIEQAIADHYHDNCLSRDAAKEVIAQFGIDRTMYVLAATIQANERDGRYGQDNKAWARAFPLVNDVTVAGGTVRDRTSELSIYQSHPGLVNLFTQMVREEDAISRPIYKGTYEQAREAGEVIEYRLSRSVNSLCQREIDDAVTSGWDGMHVAPDAVKQVLERFGPERVSFVLANTIQQRDGDERFSGDNQAWAKTVPMRVPPDKRLYCTASSHSAKLDDFITVARGEMMQMEKERGQSKVKRPSVRKKLQEQPDAPAVPKPPGKQQVKGQER